MMRAADILEHMRSLPFADLDSLAPGPSLILAPHADDESLGCGGLIAASCARGRPPIVVCVTDGAASHPRSLAYRPPRLAALREQELRDAAAILGLAADRLCFLGLPDAAAPRHGPGFDAAAARIAELAASHAVTTIFTTWAHDPHCDHAMAARLGAEASLRSGAALVFYPVWGWLLPPETELTLQALPQGARLDIAAFQPLKRRAIAAHASQYTDLVSDDPSGFRLPQALLEIFDRPYEVFLQP